MRKEKDISPLVQAWVGPYLPKEHIFVDPQKRPSGIQENIRLYSRKWLVHPIRRHRTHLYSEVLSRFGTEIIGITGSAGKTTTKELVKSVLSQKYKTVWSPGNIDPIYNIPQTVLSTPLNTEKLVLEMGIEFPGEMDFYLWLAQPKTGIVTTIYWAHTEFLKDIKNIAREKGKLVASLPPEGHAILNYDDPTVRSLAGKTKANIVWYGTGMDAEIGIRGSNIQITKDFKTRFNLHMGSSETEVNLSLLGHHFVNLALAAAAVGYINNISIEDIKKGLEKVQPIAHRMIPLVRKDGAVIIDDTYNANPLAVREAIKLMVLGGKEKRKILVLGEMKELGEFEEKGHREVGAFAAKSKVDYIYTLGDLTRYTIQEAIKKGISRKKTHMAQSKSELLEELRQVIGPGDLVLIKGSRSMKMEELVDGLM